jgi:hypothetical protein
MNIKVGQLFESPKSGFLGIITEIVPASNGYARVRIVNDARIEKWSMVQVSA